MEAQARFNESVLMAFELNRPQNLLQVGLGSEASAVAVGECVEAAQSQITIIERQLYSDPSCARVLKALHAQGLISNIRFQRVSPVQALPEMLFQKERFDMVIVHPLSDYDQNFVTLYYVGQMLEVGGLLMIPDSNNLEVRKVCHHLLMSGHYELDKRFTERQKPMALLDLVRGRYTKVPGFFKEPVEQLVKAESLLTDVDLSLFGDTLVLVKQKPPAAFCTDALAMG